MTKIIAALSFLFSIAAYADSSYECVNIRGERIALATTDEAPHIKIKRDDGFVYNCVRVGDAAHDAEGNLIVQFQGNLVNPTGTPHY